MYSRRSVLLALAVSPLVTVPITIASVCLSELGVERLKPAEMFGWGVVYSLYTLPTAYVATLLVAPLYLVHVRNRGTLIGSVEALVLGSIAGGLAGAAWLVILHNTVEARGFITVPATGIAVGASVAWLLRRTLRPAIAA